MKNVPLEVTLMILLPVLVLLAGAATTALAIRDGFTPIDAAVATTTQPEARR